MAKSNKVHTHRLQQTKLKHHSYGVQVEGVQKAYKHTKGKALSNLLWWIKEEGVYTILNRIQQHNMQANAATSQSSPKTHIHVHRSSRGSKHSVEHTRGDGGRVTVSFKSKHNTATRHNRYSTHYYARVVYTSSPRHASPNPRTQQHTPSLSHTATCMAESHTRMC